MVIAFTFLFDLVLYTQRGATKPREYGQMCPLGPYLPVFPVLTNGPST